MSLLLPSVNLLGTSHLSKTLVRSQFLLNGHAIFESSRRRSKTPAVPGFKRDVFGVRSLKSPEGSDENFSEKTLENKQWLVLQSWNVPWDWKVTIYVMMPYLMSIFLTGIVESSGLLGSLQPFTENVQPHFHNVDEEAIKLFMDQLLKTIIKLSILYVFVSPYQPFPDNIFSYRWRQPFNLQYGWILWGGGGLVIASSVVFLVNALLSGSSTSEMQNEAESLVRLLPLIGASNTSTACLLGILGVFAPFCEETLYRGFLMTSLTKWLPVHISVVVSSAVFTLAHQSPGKSIELFIFGTILGLVYARTQNLLAPITMHACWNLGVILTLMLLHSQGYEIQQYVI